MQPYKNKYYSKEGYLFHRVDEDGTVMVHCSKGVVTLDAITWASVVAAMSSKGESAESFEEAFALHQSQDSAALPCGSLRVHRKHRWVGQPEEQTFICPGSNGKINVRTNAEQ